MKLAPQTPLSALRVAELAIEAGFPPGAINTLPGDDAAGKYLAAHPDLDKLAFTGSTPVGKAIMTQAAASNKLQRVTLELGGKSPLVILDDADLDAAVAGAHTGLFLNQGQCCCAGSRIFVHESVYDEFCKKSAAMASARKVGPGWEETTAQGPQVSQEQLDTVLGYIEAGKRDGATLLTGGNRVGNKGFFVEVEGGAWGGC
jgi:aldehyde dehydrogenase (NAD+)